MTTFSSHNNNMLSSYLANMYLKQGDNPVLNYLHARGFSDETIATFRLGSTSTQRIVFPICDEDGGVCGFQTRFPNNNYDGGKKYVNSPNTACYNKSNFLYGLDVARGAALRHDKLYIVEGNFDVMRMHQVGIVNTVGIMGSLVSERQASEIRKHASHVVLVFDGDSAGQEGMCRSFINLTKQSFASICCMMIDGDPDTFFTCANPLPEELDMMQVYIEYSYNKYNMETVDGKYLFIRSMVELFGIHPDSEHFVALIAKVLRDEI
jgi:DNA primase catalytic core